MKDRFGKEVEEQALECGDCNCLMESNKYGGWDCRNEECVSYAEPIKMKDAFGVELEVGQVVAYSTGYIKVGVITKLNTCPIPALVRPSVRGYEPEIIAEPNRRGMPAGVGRAGQPLPYRCMVIPFSAAPFAAQLEFQKEFPEFFTPTSETSFAEDGFEEWFKDWCEEHRDELLDDPEEYHNLLEEAYIAGRVRPEYEEPQAHIGE